MKLTAKRWISFLLCILMMLAASMPATVTAEIEELPYEEELEGEIIDLLSGDEPEIDEDELDCEIVELLPEDELEIDETAQSGEFESEILVLGDDDGSQTGDVISDIFADTREETDSFSNALPNESGDIVKDSPLFEIPEAEDNGGLAFNASASLSVSTTSLSVKCGDTYNVLCSHSGYSGSVFLRSSYSSGSPFSTSWGSWYNHTIYLYVKGLKTGSGTITVELRDASSGSLLASRTVRVTVTASSAKIALSPTSASIQVGKTKKINVTTSGYSGSYYLSASRSDCNICTVSWGSWSGSTVPLTVKGSKTGTCTITIGMYASSNNALLKSVKLKVTVKTAPKISLSVTKATVKKGKSTDITVKCSGYSGKYTLSAKVSNTKLASCKWYTQSGKSILTIKGKKAGSCTITVIMKDANGKTLASKKINPVKIVDASKPAVSASKKTLTLTKGKSQKITLTIKNISAACKVKCTSTGSGIVSCSLGSKSGNTVPLTIKGKKTGTSTITATVRRSSDNKALASVKIKVTVKAAAAKTKSIFDMGYSFHNYSKTISLATCQYMFGYTQKARTIYSKYLGNGGCCFGFSTSAGLLDMTANAPNLNVFGSKSKISQLNKTDWSSSLGLSVTDFIEAMHITQASYYMGSAKLTGLDNLASTVKTETAAGRPVVLGIRGAVDGKNGGHAIMAYGYKQVSDTRFEITVYDCNYQYSTTNMKATTLTLTRSSASSSYNYWSYPVTSSITWGTGRLYNDLCFWKYNSYLTVWKNHGSSLNGSMNLLSTDAKDFALYGTDGNMIALYEDGCLKKSAGEVVDIPLFNIMPNGEIADMPTILYLPAGEYTVAGYSSDSPISMTMADDALSVTVETDVSQFSICANDSAGTAAASFPSGSNASYTVSLCSSRDGDPEEVRVMGSSTENDVSIGMYDGELSILGADAGDMIVSNYSSMYAITAEATDGGTITPSGIRNVAEGGSAAYTITADYGAKLVSVLVDGVDIGPVTAYTFENIHEAHTITAVFEQFGENHFDSASYDASSKSLSLKFTHAGTVTIMAAAYDSSGRMLLSAQAKAEPGVNALTLTFNGSLADAKLIKAFMLNSSLKPVCSACTVTVR